MNTSTVIKAPNIIQITIWRKCIYWVSIYRKLPWKDLKWSQSRPKKTFKISNVMFHILILVIVIWVFSLCKHSSSSTPKICVLFRMHYTSIKKNITWNKSLTTALLLSATHHGDSSIWFPRIFLLIPPTQDLAHQCPSLVPSLRIMRERGEQKSREVLVC